MGDRQRHRVFAEFVVKTFPRALEIADVGGGHGLVSWYLHEAGKQSTIIDLRTGHFPGWLNNIIHKRLVRKGELTIFKRIGKDIREVDLTPFDVIIALHPDAATEPALKAAIELNKDFAVVPCCVFPLDGVKRSREEWVDYLASLAPNINRSELSMSGANVVLWRKQE